jgi:uncharacterized membrane-anchored protein YjiN (DUF445 family)
MASFLMLLGIYNSATLVSANNELRKSIRKHALESRLLNLIGHAEMEKEIQKTVKKITQEVELKDIPANSIHNLHKQRPMDLVAGLLK